MIPDILIIMSDRRVISSIQKSLEQVGYTVRIAYNVPEAIVQLEALKPSLVICSDVLSKGSPKDVCQVIRNLGKPKIPIIIASTVASGTMIVQAKTKWDADDVVPSALPFSSLLQFIEFHLGKGTFRPGTLYHRPLFSKKSERDDQIEKGKEKKGNIPLEGNIKDISLARLFLLIGSKKHSGILHLGDNSKVRQLFLFDGMLIYVHSPYIHEESLKFIISHYGGIPLESIEPYAVKALTTKKPLGQVLVEAGKIDLKRLDRMLNRQMIRKVSNCFGWESSSYKFEKTSPPTNLPWLGKISLGSCIVEGIRQFYNPKKFESDHNESFGKIIVLNDKPIFSLKDIELDKTSRDIVLRLAGRTLRESVVESSVDSNEWRCILHALMMTKNLLLN